jgi:hypothetical protein
MRRPSTRFSERFAPGSIEPVGQFEADRALLVPAGSNDAICAIRCLDKGARVSWPVVHIQVIADASSQAALRMGLGDQSLSTLPRYPAALGALCQDIRGFRTRTIHAPYSHGLPRMELPSMEKSELSQGIPVAACVANRSIACVRGYYGRVNKRLPDDSQLARHYKQLPVGPGFLLANGFK